MLREVLVCSFSMAALLTVNAVDAQVDLSGTWAQRLHEDGPERIIGPELGNYTGLPITAGSRLRAETYDPQRYTVLEHQCEQHSPDMAPNAPANLTIERELDPVTLNVNAWHTRLSLLAAHRVIWMDGRAAPSDDLPYTWAGFSSGKWVGDTLVVNTIQMKESWVRRNGVRRSDKGKLTEFWTRHGNYLTVVSAVEDPVYLTEPLVRSWGWVLNLGYRMQSYTCIPRVEVALPKGFVAHWLPGSTSMLDEYAQKHGLPRSVTGGGAEQLYPAYLKTLEKLEPKRAQR